MVRKIIRIIRFRLEALVWIVALILLAFMSPENGHASLCPFNAFGLGFCPGCGLGHGIAYLFRGEFQASFYAHPLSIPAVILLIIRVVKVFKRPLPLLFINKN
ncbi:MAG: DUF2752 domain-containing protein [Lentimicrobiaceae bacterium]|nr:DUF2752 domain-containing protein [Lentimicrobiaceae bacterium]